MRPKLCRISALLVLWPLCLQAADDVILSELRELRSNVQQWNENVVRQGERIEANSRMGDKHELVLFGRAGDGNSPGLVREVASAKESQTRHSRLLWGVAGVVGTIIGGIGIEGARRRLWPKKKEK